MKDGQGKHIVVAIGEGYKQVEAARHLGVHYSVVSRRLRAEEKRSDVRNKT